jgi:hypothetical protein
MRSRWLCVLGICAGLVGCGTSDAERVERALESYPRALAAGDGHRACASFTREGRREAQRRGDFCAALERIASKMTSRQRLRSQLAQAVRIEVDGNRATGYLRYGGCVVITTRSMLVRDEAGDWRIERMGGPASARQSVCLE